MKKKITKFTLSWINLPVLFFTTHFFLALFVLCYIFSFAFCCFQLCRKYWICGAKVSLLMPSDSKYGMIFSGRETFLVWRTVLTSLRHYCWGEQEKNLKRKAFSLENIENPNSVRVILLLAL